MPEKFGGEKYTELITPMDEGKPKGEMGPDVANAPTEIDPPDPLGLLPGGKTPRGRKKA